MIERREMVADVLALFFTYFFFNCGGRRAASGIQNAKAYAMTAPRRFRQYFIFVCFWTGKLCVVLRHAREHIDAFSDVDNLSVQQDSVNARTLELRC
jgi:hypothetical protein